MYFQVQGIKFCLKLWSTEVADYRGCFYTKVLLNDILVRLDRILDYAGVGLERFDCIYNYYICIHNILIKTDELWL